jgi:hypothetical protein
MPRAAPAAFKGAFSELSLWLLYVATRHQVKALAATLELEGLE